MLSSHYCHRVEIINVEDDDQRRGSDNVADDVHPSNMEVRTTSLTFVHVKISFVSVLTAWALSHAFT